MASLQRTLFFLDGGLLFRTLLLQGIQLVLCFQCPHRVGPHDVLLVGTGCQSCVPASACDVYQRVIAFVYLVILFVALILSDEAADGLVAFGVHAEGVVMIGLCIEQVVQQRVVLRSFGHLSQSCQLFVGTDAVLQFGVHLQTLFHDGIAQARTCLVRLLFAGCYQLVGPSQQIECLFEIVFPMVQGSSTDTTFRSFFVLFA